MWSARSGPLRSARVRWQPRCAPLNVDVLWLLVPPRCCGCRSTQFKAGPPLLCCRRSFCRCRAGFLSLVGVAAGIVLPLCKCLPLLLHRDKQFGLGSVKKRGFLCVVFRCPPAWCCVARWCCAVQSAWGVLRVKLVPALRVCWCARVCAGSSTERGVNS